VSGSMEPVRRITGRFIQTVRLAAGSDRRDSVPAMVEPRPYISWSHTGSRPLAGHTLSGLAPLATRSHLQSPSLNRVFVTKAMGEVSDGHRHWRDRCHGLLKSLKPSHRHGFTKRFPFSPPLWEFPLLFGPQVSLSFTASQPGTIDGHWLILRLAE
jgi:hypothetical protein